MNMENRGTKYSVMDIVKSTYRNEGVKGFFKGITGRVGQYGLSAVILFPTYEFLRIKFGIDLIQYE
jgi:hypothetical protein